MSEINTAIEQFETCSKKPRGMARRSLDLIGAMHTIAAATQPITGRGIGYKLFTAGLIESMSRSEMQRVYRLLKEARERGIIPWDWIVDESRGLERRPSWRNPETYARAAIQRYRRDYWNQQSVRVEVWSEKGTIRGVLRPVLDEYGVGFRVMHGFGSATEIYGVAQYYDGRPLVVLYVLPPVSDCQTGAPRKHSPSNLIACVIRRLSDCTPMDALARFSFHRTKQAARPMLPPEMRR
jgi:hypothetical protein